MDFLRKNLYDEIIGLINDTLFGITSFPIIGHVIPQTVGQQLLSLQPLPGPTAVLTYLDYKYNDNMNIFDELIKLSYE